MQAAGGRPTERVRLCTEIGVCFEGNFSAVAQGDIIIGGDIKISAAAGGSNREAFVFGATVSGGNRDAILTGKEAVNVLRHCAIRPVESERTGGARHRKDDPAGSSTSSGWSHDSCNLKAARIIDGECSHLAAGTAVFNGEGVASCRKTGEVFGRVTSGPMVMVWRSAESDSDINGTESATAADRSFTAGNREITASGAFYIKAFVGRAAIGIRHDKAIVSDFKPGEVFRCCAMRPMIRIG